MNPRKNYVAAVGFTRREGLIALIGGIATLSGCGGGGGSSGLLGSIASVGSGGTGSFSSGAITGFGSIIVNGVRFDDSKATITDDDGVSHNSGDLKLGMVVSVTGSTVVVGTTGSSATANTITFGSELRGPIDSIGSQSLVVLGQTVQIGTNTVFDNAIVGGLAGLSVGQTIEVDGFVDPAANTIQATRIERTGNTNEFKLQGVVQALNTTAKTFTIGALTISYAGIATTDLPALANGLLVRVRLATTPATGTRTATRIRAVAREVEERDEAELEGTVTAFTSTSTFSVNGVAVDAGKASFPNGSAGLRLGARVEVEGTVTNGVVVATTVKVENEAEVENQEFELHGTVSNLNTTNKTFVIRGVTVSFAGTVRFDKGDASTLATVNGTTAIVEVKGTNNAATNSVTATRISFDN
ncbi:MAG TPA: DUF5666 domain-containing protein [Ramlibacter sp.]|nr:DUF5666 domain-containing protein [Ramlibacter sp.]